jgi:hypothetical protein
MLWGLRLLGWLWLCLLWLSQFGREDDLYRHELPLTAQRFLASR